MKKLTKITATGFACAMVSVQALNITIPPDAHWEIPAGPGSDADFVESNTGTLLQLTDLYKSEVPKAPDVSGVGIDFNAFAAFYNTQFANDPGDPEDATITWVGSDPDFIQGTEIYLLVKDGQQPTYIWDLKVLGWDGKETINITGLYPGNGAISHLSIFSGTGTLVPDGGATAIFLGAGILGMTCLRNRFKR